jgi:hypothetical protein
MMWCKLEKEEEEEKKEVSEAGRSRSTLLVAGARQAL